MDDKELTFEQRLEKAQQIVDTLSGGQLPLDQAVAAYEEGMKVLSTLEQQLTEAVQHLTVLRQNADGGLSEFPAGAEHENV